MARTAGKKQAPAKIEEEDDTEGWDDAVVDADDKEAAANLRLRDWRDVERFREMKELRRLVDDDYGLEEIFHIPVKPRAEPGIPAPHNTIKLPKTAASGAKAAAPAPAPVAKAAHGKAAPAKATATAKPDKGHAKPAAKKPAAKPAAGHALKAKAKRR